MLGTELETGPMLRNPELWQRLQSAPIMLSDGRDLGEKLAGRYRISADETAALITEYRRFLYLRAVSGEDLAPSTQVDQLWHQHLDDHEGWARYCREMFGRDLPRLWGRPAPEQDPAYLRTLAQIRQEFGATPSWQFWPDPESQAQKGRNSLNVLFAGLAASIAAGMFLGIGWGLIAMIVTLVLAVERHDAAKTPRLRRRHEESDSTAAAVVGDSTAHTSEPRGWLGWLRGGDDANCNHAGGGDFSGGDCGGSDGGSSGGGD